MKISTYITTFDALFFQSTLEQTIRQAIFFSDEIIVCPSTMTSDGTYNLLDVLRSEYPNIIKVYPYEEDNQTINNNQEMLANRRTFGLRKCTKDFCILQDDDECIHEKYAGMIKDLVNIHSEAIGFRFNTLHFYRSYNRYQNSPGWYQKKIYMVKNISSIKHGRIGGDPDNFVINHNNEYVPLEVGGVGGVGRVGGAGVLDTPVTVYHYGWCRNDAIFLLKSYFQGITWYGKDYWKSHEFPYKLCGSESLPEFKDTHPKYMIPIVEYENKFNTRHIKEFG